MLKNLEEVLVGKVKVLYSDVGDGVDFGNALLSIYKLNMLDYSMNYGNILRALEDRGIDLSRRSVFEQEIYTKEGSFLIENAINDTLESDKVDTVWVNSYGITSRVVIESVLNVLWLLREGD